MKVKDAMKLLAKMDPNAIFVTTTDNFEMGHQTVPAVGIREFNGSIAKETFRDAFDGCNYNAEVIHFDDKGKTKFVKIY
jgi:hypothetical protein